MVMRNFVASTEIPIQVKHKSEFRVLARRLSKSSSAVIGFVVAVLLVLMAILAPLIAPYPYDKQDLYNTKKPPSVEHIFGTDELGRDVFSRVVWGSRYSLSVGFLAVLFSSSVGMLLGAIAGYFGGLVDDIIMRLIDIIQSIPGILLAIAISVVLGPDFLTHY